MKGSKGCSKPSGGKSGGSSKPVTVRIAGGGKKSK